MRLVKPSYTILSHLEYPVMLKLVARAACTCYRRETPEKWREQEEFIVARIRAGHESIIEHVGFSVQFTVDRGLTHELVRHRLASFTQESTRFCNYNQEKFGSELTFVMPEIVSDVVPEGRYSVITQKETELPGVGKAILPCLQEAESRKEICIPNHAVADWVAAMIDAETAYISATGFGMTPEVARGILPNALAANIVITANMREWRHIFSLRALGKTGRPHPQMIQVMTPVLQEAIHRFPAFFQEL